MNHPLLFPLLWWERASVREKAMPKLCINRKEGDHGKCGQETPKEDAKA